jgi:hypothetical protein
VTTLITPDALKGPRRACFNENLKRHHGINVQTYERLYAQQNGRCNACGSSAPKFGAGHLEVHKQRQTIVGLRCAACREAWVVDQNQQRHQQSEGAITETRS